MTRYYNAGVLCLIPIVVLLTVYCQSDDEGKFEYRGRALIACDSIYAPDTILTTDTLFISVWSGSIWDLSDPGDKFENETIEIERDSSSASISILADIYDWVGSGSMPPTNLVPYNAEPCTLMSVFKEGIFMLEGNNPDGSLLSDTIMVLR